MEGLGLISRCRLVQGPRGWGEAHTWGSGVRGKGQGVRAQCLRLEGYEGIFESVVSCTRQNILYILFICINQSYVLFK